MLGKLLAHTLENTPLRNALYPPEFGRVEQHQKQDKQEITYFETGIIYIKGKDGTEIIHFTPQQITLQPNGNILVTHRETKKTSNLTIINTRLRLLRTLLFMLGTTQPFIEAYPQSKFLTSFYGPLERTLSSNGLWEFYKSGIVRITSPDGTVITDFSQVQSITKYSNGTIVVTKPQGQDILIIDPNGDVRKVDHQERLAEFDEAIAELSNMIGL